MAEKTVSTGNTKQTSEQQPANALTSGGPRVLITPKPLVGKELHEAIRTRVNYYLSHENLKKDAYLVSHMNPEMWVEISVLTSFKGLAMLSATVADVAEAMRESDKVVVSADGKQIKPNIKLERKTLIIRDIPMDTNPKEIEAIFSHLTGSKAPTEIHSEVGDNWFITFDTEDACLDAHLSLSNKTYNDQPIRARIKSETVAPSFYQPKVAPSYNFTQVAGTGEESEEVAYFDTNSGLYFDPATGQLYAQSRLSRDRRGGHAGGDGGRGGSKKGKKKRPQPTQPLQLGASHFPPLPTKQDLRKAGKTDNSGYGEVSYHRIDLQQSYKVFNALASENTELSNRPAFLTECAAVLESPHLSHAPYTFTSEETAEVFVQVDQTPDKRGMSPFVSPMFISVNTGADLPDFNLPPPAAPSTFAQPAPPKSTSLAPARTAKQVLTSGIRGPPPRPGPPLSATVSAPKPAAEGSSGKKGKGQGQAQGQSKAEEPAPKKEPQPQPQPAAQNNKPNNNKPAEPKPAEAKAEDKKEAGSFKAALLAKGNTEKRTAQE